MNKSEESSSILFKIIYQSDKSHILMFGNKKSLVNIDDTASSQGIKEIKGSM